MIDPDQAALILDRLGLSSETLGPVQEWAPVPRAVYQRRHDTFWRVVADMLPDNEDDEQFWMSQDATIRLRNN